MNSTGAAGRAFRCVLMVAMLTAYGAHAQSPADLKPNPPVRAAEPTVETTPPGGDSGTAVFDVRRILTRFEFWLTLLVVSFGVIVVGVQFFLLKKSRTSGDDILKVFGVTLIIVGTLALITAGFSDKQIAPAMGLFGTISGYLLGRASVRTSTDKKTQEEDLP